MTFSPRRLIITIVFVLIIGAVSIAGVFLSTFDLNHFRAEISDSISARLSQPVDLGRAHFSIKHGPSFAFNSLQIGTESAPLHLTAKHIFFRLEVLPLLLGNFRFSEVLFEEPIVNLKIGQPSTAAKSRRLFFDQSLLTGDLIRSIRINDGNIRIEDYRGSQTPFVIALNNLRMVMDDLSLEQSGKVNIKADINCNNIVSPFRLTGSIKAGESTPFWNQANYELEMRISDFASDILSQRYRKTFSRFEIAGRSDINLRLSGSPATGLSFNTTLTGRDLGLKFPNLQDPVPARRIEASGVWQNNGSFHKFDELALQFDTMNFSGNATLDLAQDDPQIAIRIAAPRLEITELNRLLQKNDHDALSEGPEFSAGVINLKTLEVVGPLSSLSSLNLLLAIRNLDLEVRKGDFSLNGKRQFSNCSFAVEVAQRKLLLKSLSVDSGNFVYAATGEIGIESIIETGAIRLAGKSELSINNRSQIDPPGNPLLPEQGLKAILHLDARHTDGSWTFSNNLLALPAIKLILRGQWDWKNERAYTFNISLPEFNMADLPLISPAIRAIQPDGKALANLQLSGNKNGSPRLQGGLTLEHVQFRIRGPLAAISELNGSIDLDWPQLKGDNLEALLGESPIDLGLEIPNLLQPQVNLSIQSEAIRADELIFRSERSFLRDVDARVSITDGGLILGPIHTRMDGGTDVTIDGTIDNFPAADTRLTIKGKYGNLDEVIGLWISDQDRTSSKRKKRKQGLLEIDIKTDAGEISHLPFESCEGHISFREQTLIIHPIKFNSGSGLGTGQVLVEFRDEEPPLLRMSGHLEDFDALAVYQQLLQRNGIVTGKLRGDFYLEGTAGNLKEVFLPSSSGSFNFEVKNGVLKKLRGLSKTLTVFNIYPLFTSSDSSKGVPFDKISGHALLTNGVLQSDDIFMKGNVMNMSLTGAQNLITNEVNQELGIMPLRTIDRLITSIPLAGWVLAGDNKALVTAHFKLTGSGDNPEITAIPIESVSKQTLGIFKRLFTLPVKIISDVGKVVNQPAPPASQTDTNEQGTTR